ncbi:hypothetical protein PLCT1_00166 [Planctomycetaceae bacterium]|nr:hypothetical protein PLCT1_00166 [Planctomycetaceae bacterium]
MTIVDCRLRIADWRCRAMAGCRSIRNPQSTIRNRSALLLAVLLCSVLASACSNPRRDAVVATPPATAQAAALVLTEELTSHGVHMRGVSASVLELFWESDWSGDAAPPPKGSETWIGNTLTYEEIQEVAEPSNGAQGWLLEIRARGGKVRLWLNDRDSALRVRAALTKLMQN